METSRASAASITQLFTSMRAGDHSASEKLWAAYCPRLLALARATLGPRAGEITDSEDAVQSAFASFWERAQQGKFAGDLHRDNLWKLLALITVRKALRHREWERAKKRGGGRVQSASSLIGPEGEAFQLEEALSHVPACELDLHCEELLGQLPLEQRSVALLRLMGYTNREIASIHGCTERKIERKLQLIRLAWEDELPL